MYYISSKEAKGVFMKMSNETKKAIANIIRYNASRKYFYDWTPRELNKSYISEDPVSLTIAGLSSDTICNTIWNEMSYNPKRFGYTSPFKFDGNNSIYLFINSDLTSETNAQNILSKVKYYLSDFWNLAVYYDETFLRTGCFKNKNISITNIPNSTPGAKPIPCPNYKMLGDLRTCIHIVASQNITDFNKDKAYREEIINTVRSKHPNLIRAKQTIHPELQKLLNKKLRIEHAIWNKNSEIMDTESRINTLNTEFENPGDTSADTARLEQQNSDLIKLENLLANIKKQISSFGTDTYQK
jgi:hypothetical protein